MQKVKRIILFGGTLALFDFVVGASKKNFEVIIFTNDFRLNLPINELGTLKNNLETKGFDYIKTDNLSKEKISKYIDKYTIGLSITTIWIFKEDIIKLFDGKLYNYHGARLPEERGGGTYTWKILSRSRMGGLTIHQVLPSIDTGDIVFAHEFIFPNECRIPIDYMKHVESEEREFLLHFLNMLEQGQELKLIPQQEDHASYWPILNTTMNGSVDWDWNVDEIEIFINAFDDPYKGAFTFYENRKIHLKKCFKNDQAETFHPFQAGIIFRIHNETLYIAAVGGCIAVKDVFDEKGNRINNQIRIGYRLHTPYSHLESAKKDKARYGSRGLQSSKRAIRRE